ncbi:MAG: hypothetical protein IJU52_02840, partial [Clostridia bacterium]|nr:hypothetical protein [Clostridia bacterium]
MGEGGACRRMRLNTTVGLWRRRSRQNDILIICDKSDVGNVNPLFFLFFLSFKKVVCSLFYIWSDIRKQTI